MFPFTIAGLVYDDISYNTLVNWVVYNGLGDDGSIAKGKNHSFAVNFVYGKPRKYFLKLTHVLNSS